MTADEPDAATQAFDALRGAIEQQRGELALLRRAVEGLAAERGAIDVPDYSETLGVISHNLTATAQRVDLLANSPALAMTPESMTQRIAAAGSAARREERDELARARAGFDQATRELAGYVMSARRGDEQNRWLAGAGAGGVALGLLLWAALAGPIARAMPESWYWPEQRAARALDMPMWQAGGQLLATADSAAYRQIIADEQLARANRETIEGCKKAAQRAGNTVRCTVRIGGEQLPTAGQADRRR